MVGCAKSGVMLEGRLQAGEEVERGSAASSISESLLICSAVKAIKSSEHQRSVEEYVVYEP